MHQEPERMSDSSSVEDVVRRLVEAWNRRDTRAFGDAFAPAAEYVTGAGQQIQGRERIAALLAGRGDGSTIAVVDRPSIEQSGPTARIRFDWATAGDVGTPRHGTISCVIAWHSTGWLIEALHNEESS